MAMPPNGVEVIEPWYLANLVWPRDPGDLHVTEGGLTCAAGHHYRVVDGVPVMLLEDVRQTLEVATTSLDAADVAQFQFEVIELGNAMPSARASVRRFSTNCNGAKKQPPGSLDPRRPTSVAPAPGGGGQPPH
jgi:uncharacterized protein YbaR (Trm112 family)